MAVQREAITHAAKPLHGGRDAQQRVRHGLHLAPLRRRQRQPLQRRRNHPSRCASVIVGSASRAGERVPRGPHRPRITRVAQGIQPSLRREGADGQGPLRRAVGGVEERLGELRLSLHLRVAVAAGVGEGEGVPRGERLIGGRGPRALEVAAVLAEQLRPSIASGGSEVG